MGMFEKMTNEQKAAVMARGFVLTTASAGSGKTAVLVERVITILRDEVNLVDADKLLVVTFTKAAAAELKERIVKRLAEEIIETGNQRLVKQELLIDNAQIVTIDSFCSYICKEYFYELDLSPDFAVADNAKSEQILNDAVQNVLDKRYSSGDKDFFMLLSGVNYGFDDSAIVEQIKQVYYFLRSQPNPKEWLNSLHNECDSEAFIEKTLSSCLANAKENIIQIIKLCKNAIQKCQEHDVFIKKYQPAFEELLNVATTMQSMCINSQWDDLYDIINNFSMPRLGQAKGEEIDEMKEILKKIKETIKKEIEIISSIIIDSRENCTANIVLLSKRTKAMVDIINEVIDECDSAKKQENIADFSDIELFVLDLLTRDDAALKESIVSRFDSILVDEFQDTNDLQNRLFAELSNNFENIFIVGDAKQSIYGFRDANPNNFLKLGEITNDETHNKIILQANFRSRQNICESANIIFEKIMSTKVGDIEYNQNEKLVPLAKFAENNNSEVEFVIIENDDKNEKVIAEAEFVTKRIIELLGEEAFVSDGNGGVRAAAPGDFAIFLRNKKHTDIYIETLTKNGINTYAKPTISFLECSEIMVFVSLLKIINNPDLDLPMLSVLHSCISEFSLQDIAQLKVKSKAKSFFAVLKESDDEKCIKFVKQLEFFQQLAFECNCYKLINKLFDHTKYIYLVSAMSDGNRRKNNLLRLLDIARDFDNSGEYKLYFFVKYLERLEENQSGIESSGDSANYNNSVKILTIHGSKGLQFPVCFICGSSSLFNMRSARQTLLLDKEFGMGQKLFDMKSSRETDTVLRKLIASNIKTKLLSEEMRLLYVALTRAQDKLIITGECSNAENLIKKACDQLALYESGYVNNNLISNSRCFLEWMILALGSIKNISSENTDDFFGKVVNNKFAFDIKLIRHEKAEESSENCKKIISEVDNELLENINKQLNFIYEYDYLNTIFTKVSASHLKENDLDIAGISNARPNFLRKHLLNAAETGTAHHEFLQFCDFNIAKNNVDAEKQRLLNEEYLSETKINSLDNNKLDRFFNSNLFDRIMSADKILREQRFMIELPVGEIVNDVDERLKNEPLVVQGVIDLVMINGESAVVVDYKTDRCSEKNEFISRYSDQLCVYASAVNKIIGVKVTECLIYSLYLNETISIPLKTTVL